MKKSHFSRMAMAAGLCCLVFFACKRDRVTWDGELASTIDNNFADSEFGAIRNMVDTEGQADSVIYGKTTGVDGIFCPTSSATINITGPGSAIMTIDFGTGSNCLDGRLRTGKLIADFQGKWGTPGSTVTITPDGYTVAGYAFSFSQLVTFNGRDGNGNLNWSHDVTNAVLYHPANGTIQWSGNRLTTWIEGEGNLDPQTYVYEIMGGASGTARNGLTFTAEVDNPLRVELACQWITGGVWTISPQGRDKRSIDYGNNTCDNQAVLRVGDFETVVSLP